MFRKLNIVGTLIECNRPGLFVRISAKSWHQLSGTIWPRVSPTRVEITQSRRGTLRGQVDKTHDLLCGLPTLRVRHLSWHTHFYIFHTKSTLATRQNPLTWFSKYDVIHRSDSPPRRKTNQVQRRTAQSALALLAFASLVKIPAFQFSSKSSVLQPLFSSHRKIIYSAPFCLNTSDPTWVNLYVSILLISAVHGPLHWLSSSIFPCLYGRLSVPVCWHPTKSPLFSIYAGKKALY